MKKLFLTFSILLISFAYCTAQIIADSIYLKVVIIRHGEKPDSGNNLSCQGLNRALALPGVLDTVTGKPNYTYVPTMKTGKKTSSVRMFQTVTPFAVQQNLMINSNYKETDSTGAANDVLKKKGVVLMVWEHGNIPPLARALVGKSHQNVLPQTPWGKYDFGSIWIIQFRMTKKGNLTFSSFDIEQENLNPSPNCN
ncbi:MAG: histidine phosphatase family protein [Bacteroidetes bacterium]|nr:histidine phosphatase family protein [Bacteroidota bacterium]